jgi:hypothetical protein
MSTTKEFSQNLLVGPYSLGCVGEEVPYELQRDGVGDARLESKCRRLKCLQLLEPVSTTFS